MPSSQMGLFFKTKARAQASSATIIENEQSKKSVTAIYTRAENPLCSYMLRHYSVGLLVKG